MQLQLRYGRAVSGTTSRPRPPVRVGWWLATLARRWAARLRRSAIYRSKRARRARAARFLNPEVESDLLGSAALRPFLAFVKSSRSRALLGLSFSRARFAPCWAPLRSASCRTCEISWWGGSTSIVKNARTDRRTAEKFIITNTCGESWVSSGAEAKAEAETEPVVYYM